MTKKSEKVQEEKRSLDQILEDLKKKSPEEIRSILSLMKDVDRRAIFTALLLKEE